MLSETFGNWKFLPMRSSKVGARGVTDILGSVDRAGPRVCPCKIHPVGGIRPFGRALRQESGEDIHEKQGNPSPRQDEEDQGGARPDDGNEDPGKGPDHRPYGAGQRQVVVRVRHARPLHCAWHASCRDPVHQGRLGNGRARLLRQPLCRQGDLGDQRRRFHLGNAGSRTRHRRGAGRLGKGQGPDPRP